MANGTRKVLLRLDDGSLIGRASDLGTDPASDRVVRLSVDQAAQIGRAGDREITRLETILERIKAAHGISNAVLEARQQPPAKKARQDSIAYTAAVVPGGNAWATKCMDILKKLLKHLGGNAKVYYEPVDPRLLPDYYTVVKFPLFLKDIEQRLQTDYYQQPEDFLQDINHHFSNVFLYNPVGDPFRAIGEKAQQYFNSLWGNTSFTADRGKRATAGHAAPKYDPDLEPPAKPKQSRSQGAGSKRPRDGVGRTASHEVTSGKHGFDDQGRLTQERIQEIGQYLSREDLPEDQSAHLISLLPPEMVAGIESGELELDFDVLDHDTLLRIDAWLRTVPEAQAMSALNQPPALPPPQALPAAPRPSQSRGRTVYDDDDDDYEEEDDDDDSD